MTVTNFGRDPQKDLIHMYTWIVCLTDIGRIRTTGEELVKNTQIEPMGNVDLLEEADFRLGLCRVREHPILTGEGDSSVLNVT